MLRKRGTESVKETPDLQPILKEAKKTSKGSKKLFLASVFLVVFVLYVIIPLSVYLCPAVRRHAVFLNYISLSQQKNLSLPSESGLSCSKNYYIDSEGDIKLGVWHVPPHSVLPKCKGDSVPLTEAFQGPEPVFLYLHGNAGTRAGNHRVQLYKLLSESVDAHIIAFDYRGFGDSSNVSPTEGGLVQDTLHVYNWLQEHVSSSRIFVWGHSLGTGVGVAFLEKLSTYKTKPAALILEAPFTKIIDAARHHPLSIFHRYMPFFDTLIAKPIGDKDTGFDSLSRISQISCPLLILHAEDDGFVPFDHGKKLYEEAVIARKALQTHKTQFVGFDGKLDFGHKNIYLSPELPHIIKKFIKDVNAIK